MSNNERIVSNIKINVKNEQIKLNNPDALITNPNIESNADKLDNFV